MEFITNVLDVIVPHLDTVFMIIAGIVALTPTEFDDTVVARMRNILQKLGILKMSEVEAKKKVAVHKAINQIDEEEAAKKIG